MGKQFKGQVKAVQGGPGFEMKLATFCAVAWMGRLVGAWLGKLSG